MMVVEVGEENDGMNDGSLENYWGQIIFSKRKGSNCIF